MYVKAEKDGVRTRAAPLANLSPEQVTLDVALELLSYPRPLGKHPESGQIVELRRASSTGKVRVGHGDRCAYLPKVDQPPTSLPSPSWPSHPLIRQLPDLFPALWQAQPSGMQKYGTISDHLVHVMLNC